MRNIRFCLAPIGVAIGISLFVALSGLIVRALRMSSLTVVFPFVPYGVFAIVGTVLVVMWLPVFVLGICSLGRRGAVGQSEQLITQGIYRHVRNPMYSGISLTIFGVGLLLNSSGVALAGVLWLAIAAIQCKREEKELAERFGSAYIDYKSKTPMFLPDFAELLRELKR